MVVVGAGIVGLATARELSLRHDGIRIAVAGARAGDRNAPDRPLLRGHPRGHLLRAGLAQGAPLRRGRARALRLLRRAWHPHRARRQADRRDPAGGAAAPGRAGAPGRRERGAGPRAGRPGRDRRHRAACSRDRGAPLPRHRHRGLPSRRARLRGRCGGGGRHRHHGLRGAGDPRARRRRGGRSRAGQDAGAGARELRGRLVGPPGGGGRRPGRPAHRPVPRRLPAPPARAGVARAIEHLPGARSRPALPGRTPHARLRRRGASGPDRAHGRGAGRLQGGPDPRPRSVADGVLAGDVADGRHRTGGRA